MFSRQYQYTRRFNGNFPRESGLTACPLDPYGWLVQNCVRQGALLTATKRITRWNSLDHFSTNWLLKKGTLLHLRQRNGLYMPDAPHFTHSAASNAHWMELKALHTTCTEDHQQISSFLHSLPNSWQKQHCSFYIGSPTPIPHALTKPLKAKFHYAR